MRVGFTVRHPFRADAARLFDFTNDAANFVSFVGSGPVPGIREARYETAGEPRLGSRRRVFNTNNTQHTEEIVLFDRPRRHISRITDIAPPFSWLVRFGEDDWGFDGASVVRTFTFELTSPFAALIAYPLLHLFMRPAVSRDLRNIAKAIGEPG